MNRCEKYSDWIADAALGTLASGREPELLAHAAECDACREAYEHARQVAAFVDRGVESLVSGEPSPNFNSRLRARLAEEQAPARLAWLTWKPLTAAVVGFALLVLLLFSREFRRNPVQPAIVTTTTSKGEFNAPAPAVRNLPAQATAVATTRKAHHIASGAALPSHRQQPEVVVPPGQLEAAMQFADALRSGRIDGPQLVAVQQDLAKPIEIKPIEIAPLETPQPDASSDSSADPGRP